MGTRAWWVAAIVGAALLLPIWTLPRGIALELTWALVAALTFVATRVGLRLHPPLRRGPYELLSAAAGIIAVAGILELSWWASSADSLAITLASLLYLVSFALFSVGMFRFVASRMPTGDAEGLIDGALVAIAAATVLYDAITAPAVAGVYSRAGSAALILLPLMMATVLASIVRVLLTGTHRYLSIWLFLGAAVASMTANVLFIASDPAARTLRPLFLAGYVLLACAVLHPTSARLGEPAPIHGTSLAFGRLAVIGGALASLPAVMLRSSSGASKVPALAAIVSVGLVLWRIARLLRERERAAEILGHRAEREGALSALGRAAVTATGPVSFTSDLTAAVEGVLGATAILSESAIDGNVRDARCVLVPLGATRRALEVRFPDGHTATDDDRRFVRTAADLAAAALRRWEVEDQLRHRSLHDHLTGLPNRALVSERLLTAIRRCRATGAPLVVLFIDLDGFKVVNDTLGHAAGDDVLGEVAERLVSQVRPEDLVGRLAGDEFVVVCEDAAADTATTLAHRVLDALSAPFQLDLGDTHIGASIGVAHAEAADDPETLLQRADAAMYHAKNAGKGRVTVSSGTASVGPRSLLG